MRLYLDTETSGLRRDKLPIDHPSQPRLLQIGAKLCEDDGRRVGRYTAIIKPDGWTIEPEAQLIHGISERKAYRCGVPVITALVALRGLAEKATEIVGHHIQYDRAILSREVKLARANVNWWDYDRTFICTMELSRDIVKLPPVPGMAEFKYPTLDEAFEFFFPDRKRPEVHDAEDDMEVMSEIHAAILGRCDGA